jgi:hypothetical protein
MRLMINRARQPTARECRGCCTRSNSTVLPSCEVSDQSELKETAALLTLES